MKKSILLAVLVILTAVSCQKDNVIRITHWKVASCLYISPEDGFDRSEPHILYKDIGLNHSSNPKWKLRYMRNLHEAFREENSIGGFDDFEYEEGYEYIIEVSIVDYGPDWECYAKIFNKIVSKEKKDTEVDPNDIDLRITSLCY